jgi:hypothetical protein
VCEPNQYRTDDLALAAFLRVKGFQLSRVEKIQPNRTDSKRAFYFEVPESQLQELKLEFVNSDILRFYNEILGLKKL